MTWDKPKKPWQWLLLLTPPAICVISTLLGGLILPKNGDWTSFALVGLFIATITAFGLSIWLARVNPTAGGKIACTILCFFIFMVVTGGVSAAGCAVGFSAFSQLNFH
jgi:hypothetical protein